MSQEKVDLVRREYVALAARDWATLAEIWHPEVEYEALDPATYRGLDELKTGFMGWSELFAEWWVEADRIEAVGDQVVVTERYGGSKLKGSAAESRLDQSMGRLISFKDGKIWRSKEYRTFDQALEAAGLSESTMSQENVEVVRQGFAAFNRGEVEAFLQHWASDGIVDWSNSRGLDARVFRGHEEIGAFMRGFVGAFEGVRLELVDGPVELEPGLLIAENVAYMRGRDGIEVQARSAFLIRVRDGVQTSLTLYQTKQEALEAAGLSE